jgi:hypothetical protein
MKIFPFCAVWIVLGAGLVVAIAPLPGIAADSVFTIPRSQLLSDSEFGTKAWGPGTLVSRTAGPGDAVDFAFTGLGTSGTGVKDDYPVDPVYGQVLPSHGNGDFSGFSGYALRFENLDDGAAWIHLCMNTGFTGASGTPSNDVTNNTFWTSSPGWQELGPGGDLLVILDFDGAIAYQISDNKAPHSGGGLGWPDGDVYAINPFDRKELSAIGFEIADFAGANPDAVIRLTPVPADAGIGVDIPDVGLGGAVALEAYPNPGRALTIRIACAGSFGGGTHPASLAIYDVQGHLVRALWLGWLEDGWLELSWDGANAAAVRCTPGLYFLRLDTGSGCCTRPVLLLE